MQRLDGIAENVRHTIHVSAGGSGTDHLALFEVDGVRLSFRGTSPVAIKDGDDLSVVWAEGDKGFDTVLAFHNHTLDVRAHDINAGGCTGCGCTVVVLLMTALAIGWDAVEQQDWVFGLIAIVVASVGIGAHLAGRIYERRTADRLREAHELLDEDGE